MTLPDLHLAEDALCAYVDGLLSPAADERASRHLRACPECATAIDAEREAKALLGATPDPELPVGLLTRLLEIPMTADLGGTDRVLAFDGTALGWTDAPAPGSTRLVERRAAAPAPTRAPARGRGPVRPVGAARPGTRGVRSRRTRRGLAVSLAGLAFGVIASAAASTATGSAAQRPGGVPGSTPSQRLVVGTGTSMDVSRTFLFRRSAGAPTLVPSSTASRGR